MRLAVKRCLCERGVSLLVSAEGKQQTPKVFAWHRQKGVLGLLRPCAPSV